jgi:hypothetical protein
MAARSIVPTPTDHDGVLDFFERAPVVDDTSTRPSSSNARISSAASLVLLPHDGAFGAKEVPVDARSPDAVTHGQR